MNLPLVSLIWLLYATGLFPVTATMSLWKALEFIAQPIYEILEEAYSGDITLLVVNARHMKNVPGKKSDMRDSEWIVTFLRAGLLNGSFIPDKQIREFRYLNRYRKSIIRDITQIYHNQQNFLSLTVLMQHIFLESLCLWQYC